MVIQKERVALGEIATFFGTRRGRMRPERFLSQYGVKLGEGNKTEKIGQLINSIYDGQREFLPNILEALLNYHEISSVELIKIDGYLKPLGLQVKDGKVIPIVEDEDWFNIFEQYLRIPHAQAAEMGLGDGAILTLTEQLQSITNEFILVDYGCGEGRLLYELNTLDNRVLHNLHYVGVDINEDYLTKTKENILKLGLDKKLRGFYLYSKGDFNRLKFDIDLLFMINVLHEIGLNELPYLLYDLDSKLKLGSKILIHDMRQLKEGEKKFITWERQDLDIFFDQTNFDCICREYESRTGLKFINVLLTKKTSKPSSSTMYIDNILSAIGPKINRINQELAEIFNSNIYPERYGYLLVLRYNIEMQKKQFELEEREMHQGTPFSDYYKCENCDSRRLAIFENIIRCSRCGHEITI